MGSQVSAGYPDLDVPAAQRRIVGTLVSAQVLSGVGMASGIAVGALLAEELSGSESLAGLGTTFQVLGGALIAIPLARIMAARGRGPGLQFGYALAIAGSLIVMASALVGNFPLMLAGMLLFGGGTASNAQARFAAADLAQEIHRGRDLSIVVWATTIGSVVGPNLIGPGGALGRAVGIPPLAGSFLFSLAAFLLALTVIRKLLKPDPLLVSRALARKESASDEEDSDGSLTRGLKVLLAKREALVGTLTVALGHVVMVGIMVMTPIHMKHGDSGLGLIGVVLSVHVAGMYALSPLVGLAVDRWGGRVVAGTGGLTLVVAVVMAALSEAGWSALLLVALLLLGVGWSGTFVAGSTMLTAAVEPDERPAVQGLTEVVMGVMAASGAAVAGFVMEKFQFGALGFGAGTVSVLIIVLSAISGRNAPRAGSGG